MKKETVKTTLDLTAVSNGGIPWLLLLNEAASERLPYVQTSRWDTDVDTPVSKLLELSEGRCRSFYRDTYSATTLLTLKDGVGYISANRNEVTVLTAGTTPNGSQHLHLGLVDETRKIFPLVAPTDDGTIQIRYWMLGSAGATSRTRRIEVPSWSDISKNYSSPAATPLTGLMDNFQPSRGGRLVLWHGLPGTGKTFALRALSYEWRHWCTTEYIVDPEAFFGSAAYMMGVVMGEDRTYTPVEDYNAKTHPNAKQGKWRLLILEDAGELLAEDARQREGQALSRFLNLADGMIGQGMRVIALVTTNEPLGKLHPAVGRPGRCAAEVEFKPFTVDEAQSWLKDREVETSSIPRKGRTLAELYATVEGFAGAKGGTKAKMGLGSGS